MKNMSNTSFSETLPSGFSFEMIYVEGGTFMMGSHEISEGFREAPIHKVVLESFFIGMHVVTQALWKAIMGIHNNPSFLKADNRPVEQVNWEDIHVFIHKLNELTGKNYRLPTEAEWEYAARGGAKSEGYNYAGSNKLKEVGWYKENSHGETKEVGLKYPNELGIYDMSGNVWEWCRDWYNISYYEECYKQKKVVNPTGPIEGAGKILRGGSWNRPPHYCRCTCRIAVDPRGSSRDNGFRLVLPIE